MIRKPFPFLFKISVSKIDFPVHAISLERLGLENICLANSEALDCRCAFWHYRTNMINFWSPIFNISGDITNRPIDSMFIDSMFKRKRLTCRWLFWYDHFQSRMRKMADFYSSGDILETSRPGSLMFDPNWSASPVQVSCDIFEWKLSSYSCTWGKIADYLNIQAIAWERKGLETQSLVKLKRLTWRRVEFMNDS